jgi:hypothetical protein
MLPLRPRDGEPTPLAATRRMDLSPRSGLPVPSKCHRSHGPLGDPSPHRPPTRGGHLREDTGRIVCPRLSRSSRHQRILSGWGPGDPRGGDLRARDVPGATRNPGASFQSAKVFGSKEGPRPTSLPTIARTRREEGAPSDQLPTSCPHPFAGRSIGSRPFGARPRGPHRTPSTPATPFGLRKRKSWGFPLPIRSSSSLLLASVGTPPSIGLQGRGSGSPDPMAQSLSHVTHLPEMW